MGERSLAIRRGLAANAGLPFDVVRPLLHTADAWTARALAEREDLTPEAVEVLAVHPDVRVRKALAIAGHAAARLAGDPEQQVRHELAAAPVPEDVLWRLAHDEDEEVRARVARHKPPEHIVHVLARDAAKSVRAAVALNKPSEPVLRLLLADPHPDVRYHATAMTPPPPDLLDALLADATTRAAAALWATPTPALAEDPDPTVRRRVARNPVTPLPLLLRLAEDPVWFVREDVMLHPALPDDVRARVESTVKAQRYHLASWLLQARASLAERLRHVDSPFVYFRRAVAHSTDLPQDAIDRLATDEDFRVRLALARQNKTVPGEMLAALIPELGKAKWALAKHPALHADPFATSADSQLRIFAALNPRLAPRTALLLTTDSNPAVRRKAAANPALPLDAVLKLLEDNDDEVVTAAASNPALPEHLANELLATE
ncbi:hypothetical protein [Actinophytocola sp.]|uniref:hypothetical protein n=1 Tax=Actinophytocola sp. TaxID=1872138 RepID=UPI002ED62872